MSSTIITTSSNDLHLNLYHTTSCFHRSYSIILEYLFLILTLGIEGFALPNLRLFSYQTSLPIITTEEKLKNVLFFFFNHRFVGFSIEPNSKKPPPKKNDHCCIRHLSNSDPLVGQHHAGFKRCFNRTFPVPA